MDRVVLEYADKWLTEEVCKGRTVIEVGSMDVNGSVRPFVERHGPASYLGTDIAAGPRVDLVAPFDELEGSYSMVVTTECAEHVRNWRAFVTKIKDLLQPGGYLFFTTRAPDFPLHLYPEDHHRFSESQFRQIFTDFEIISLEECRLSQGIMMLAKKPTTWVSHPDYSKMEVGKAPQH